MLFKTKKYWHLVVPMIFLFVSWSATSFGAGTPAWWDNPYGYTEWSITTSTGTLFNEGPQAQFLTARVDVPNACAENAYKTVWMQIEWRVPYGDGQLMTGPSDIFIEWMNNAAQCPTHPIAPFPTPPSGSGHMGYMGIMAPPGPEHGFTHGDEFFFGPIITRPACERIEVRFWADSTSRIDYRIEIQTICAGEDFGDAPDPLDSTPGQYPTLRENNGARHVIIAGLHMGQSIDGETQGLATSTALGDNIGATNDEDGVNPAQLNLNQGAIPSIQVRVLNTTGRQATLTGWIDYNGDGVWNNAGEKAPPVSVPDGTNGLITLTFPVVPIGAAPQTFSRFRLSTIAQDILNPSGLAGDGEVEDYGVTIQPLDFGDAPDPLNNTPGLYPTLMAHNGARHIVNRALHMGKLIDAEADGQPTVNADGDDNNSSDDEDGVMNTSQLGLTQGMPPAIDISTVNNTGVQATLIGWIDYNGDGIFAGDERSAPFMVPGGTNLISVILPAVPLNAVRNTYARFRLSTHAAAIEQPTGLADDGEVEDYKIFIQGIDYGDAPKPYPTSLADNGARHLIVPELSLGTAPDAEIDGQPFPKATGDDTHQTDDEDGVDPEQLVITIGTSPTIDVNVVNNTGHEACVVGWIDYNMNGQWDNLTERATMESVPAGTNGIVTLHFPEVPMNTLPPGVQTDTTYARFRISNDCQSIIDPTGYSRSGEVEDYWAEILVPVELSNFSAMSVDGGIRIEWITQSESENLGFHVLRSEVKDSGYKQITSQLIKGAGNTAKENRYSFIDQNIEAGNTYYYKLADVDFNGTVTLHGPINVVAAAPREYVLEQNFPNPFNPSTTISFRLKTSGHVNLTIYNMTGQIVRTLVNEVRKTGIYSILWDGTNDAGSQVPSGMYIYTLKCSGFTQARKMTFMK
jgi:hypothetical protein